MIENSITNLPDDSQKIESSNSFDLRPKSFDSYIGQPKVTKQLKIMIGAADKKSAPLDHVLLHGPPGLGKTSLANVIALSTGSNFIVTSGQALTKVGDLAAILSNLKPFDILFIDEIHRLKMDIQEMLYTAMEDFAIDIIIGTGPSARTMRLELAKFTLVGATTKLNKISRPMRDRFGALMPLEFYSTSELEEILKLSAKNLNFEVPLEVLCKIAEHSRGTPRIANNFLKRFHDYILHHNIKNSSVRDLEIVFDLLGVQILGLNELDLNLLRSIKTNFLGGRVGFKTLSASLSEDPDHIENISEPYLIKLGFLNRSNRGRVLTSKGDLIIKDVLNL